MEDKEIVKQVTQNQMVMGMPKQEESMTNAIPTVILHGLTILPDMVIHFDLNKEKSLLAVEHAMLDDQKILIVTKINPQDTDPELDQLYPVGTIAGIKQMTKLPGQVVRVLVEGIARAEVNSLDKSLPYLTASVTIWNEETTGLNPEETEAMLRTLREVFGEYAVCFPKIGESLKQQVEESWDLGRLLDQITINIPLSCPKKQQVLSALKIEDRFEVLTGILVNEVEIFKIKSKLTIEVKKKIDQSQREYILREHLRYIRQELGEDNTFSEVEQFREALEKLKAGKEVRERIAKEIARFQSVALSSSESAVERTYIETLLELPWNKASRDSLDLDKAEKLLNDQHYGLHKVKERMMEFLAVRALTKKGESPIICLVGPPGTGKTSIAKSIAEALHKKYVRICLGGVRDEAEIRGHRKTYVGAMPGRIVDGLRQAGVKNPLMLLDEIDKVSSDYKGDTASALLEVLDGAQNSRFRDHYVEIPVDLSEVLFIATANATDRIPRPLLDRMEIIEVNSYTANEKFHIAKEHLLAKQLAANGLSKKQLQINDEAIRSIIASYTREAGVRGLERRIGELCRKTAREILQNGKKQVKVTDKNMERYLGKPKYDINPVNEKDEIGIVRGLAWTSVGGDTLQIEVNVMPGEGKIDLTGQMGDVMKESAKIAMSYVRSVSSEYNIADEIFETNDFHLHIPEGAVPKDGPSAGITMATAILSAVTGIPVYAKVAMTGEITLRGHVLPIGGLKEKILAARSSGIETVLVPEKNQKDIAEMEEEVKEGLKIRYVATMEDVIKYALHRTGGRKGKREVQDGH